MTYQTALATIKRTFITCRNIGISNRVAGSMAMQAATVLLDRYRNNYGKAKQYANNQLIDAGLESQDAMDFWEMVRDEVENMEFIGVKTIGDIPVFCFGR